MQVRCSEGVATHTGPESCVSGREAIEAVGAKLLFLPRYSPDFNPIEKAFSKLKALLRKAAERTVSGVRQAIRRILAGITPTECANFFAQAGYEPS